MDNTLDFIKYSQFLLFLLIFLICCLVLCIYFYLNQSSRVTLPLKLKVWVVEQFTKCLLNTFMHSNFSCAGFEHGGLQIQG